MAAELTSSHRLKRAHVSSSLAHVMPALCRAEPRDEQTLPLPEFQTPVLSCPFGIPTHMSNARLFMSIHTWIITPPPTSSHTPHLISTLSFQLFKLIPRSHLDPPSPTLESKLPANSDSFQTCSESTYFSHLHCHCLGLCRHYHLPGLL